MNTDKLKEGYVSVTMPIDFRGKYFINACGKVRNLKRELKFQTKWNGYNNVSFTMNGKTRTFKVARLVALHFIANPENKPMVNHKDGNKLNDHIDNLEWCTAKENVRHAFTAGLKSNHIKGERVHCSKLKPDDVVYIRNSKEMGITLAEKFGVTNQTISFTRNRRNWKHI